MKEKKKKKKKLSKLTIVCAIFDILVLVFLFVVYGPFDKFKNWWITTALATGNHKYFANVLYSKSDIQNTLQRNKILESDQNTKVEDIIFDNSKKDNFKKRRWK